MSVFDIDDVIIWHRCCVCLFVIFFLFCQSAAKNVRKCMHDAYVNFVVVVAEVVVKAYATEISSIDEAKLPRQRRISRIWLVYIRKSRRTALASRLLMQFCTIFSKTATWNFSRSDSFSWNLSTYVSPANSSEVLSCLDYSLVVLWRETGKVTLSALDVQRFEVLMMLKNCFPCTVYFPHLVRGYSQMRFRKMVLNEWNIENTWVVRRERRTLIGRRQFRRLVCSLQSQLELTSDNLAAPMNNSQVEFLWKRRHCVLLRLSPASVKTFTQAALCFFVCFLGKEVDFGTVAETHKKP